MSDNKNRYIHDYHKRLKKEIENLNNIIKEKDGFYNILNYQYESCKKELDKFKNFNIFFAKKILEEKGVEWFENLQEEFEKFCIVNDRLK